MNCREFNNLIPAFFEDELEVDDARAFIKHVSECKECAEELEIMHLLLVGLKQLDNDEEEDNYDFQTILKNRFIELEEHCTKVKNFENLHKAVIVMLNIVTILGMGFFAYLYFGGGL
ncbi:MAG: zf-HC2 domain-containing protein [Lachnospiraceae bacterium]|nr:zf-HC2 domain-containing protein [Lachnospiraceae bacterium]